MSQETSLNDRISNLKFFDNLPSDFVIEILSRLPVRAILICKCVCKSWQHLIETGEFVKSHLSKSVQGLTLLQIDDNRYDLFKFLEFEDEFDVDHHDLPYNLGTNFNLPTGWLYGSTDGLLFMCKRSKIKTKPDVLCICNPVTRDYINLNCPQEFVGTDLQMVTYGFGSSKMTSQYKVVRISYEYINDEETLTLQNFFEPECYVYTLGTRSWRRCASCGILEYMSHTNALFFNGNLLWVVRDSNRRIWVSCFDLETESFSTFSAPPFPSDGESTFFETLGLFEWGDSLGLCDNTPNDKIVIWLMKENGVEKSWRKEFIINKDVVGLDGDILKNIIFFPIKIFKDGDILFDWDNDFFMYYSSKTKTIREVDIFRMPSGNMTDAILHTPSFISLKSFDLENVSSFCRLSALGVAE